MKSVTIDLVYLENIIGNHIVDCEVVDSIIYDIKSFISKQESFTTPSYLEVEFTVIGDDHAGYCSGEEADEDREWTETRIVECPKKLKDAQCFKGKKLQKKYLPYLNDKHQGCNSGGSGYCSDFHQIYTAIKASITHNKPDYEHE